MPPPPRVRATTAKAGCFEGPEGAGLGGAVRLAPGLSFRSCDVESRGPAGPQRCCRVRRGRSCSMPHCVAVCGGTSTWMGWSPCPDVGEGEALASGPWASRAGRAPRAPGSVKLSAHGWPCQAALLRLRSRKAADSGRLPGSRGRAGAPLPVGGSCDSWCVPRTWCSLSLGLGPRTLWSEPLQGHAGPPCPPPEVAAPGPRSGCGGGCTGTVGWVAVPAWPFWASDLGPQPPALWLGSAGLSERLRAAVPRVSPAWCFLAVRLWTSSLPSLCLGFYS